MNGMMRNGRRQPGLIAVVMPAGLLMLMASIGAAPAAAQDAYVLSNNSLLRTDLANPGVVEATIPITGMVPPEHIVAIDFRPINGHLYGLGHNDLNNTMRLYHISHRTGVATPFPVTITVPGYSFGFDIAPDTDRVRVISEAGANLRLDPNTGDVVASDTPLNTGTTSADAVAFTNYGTTATATTQYVLDGMSNSLYRATSPNTGTLAAGLTVMLAGGGGPIDFTSVNGFDILPNVDAAAPNAPVAAGSGIAALTVGGVPRLYSIDLTTAIATPLGTIGDGAVPVRGLALHGERHPGGLPAVYARGTNLYRFDTANPGATVSVPVTTELDSLAWRPQTGQLYGMSFDEVSMFLTTYRVDPATGVLFPLPVQYQFPLSTRFAFTFEPNTDLLRLVSDDGYNVLLWPGDASLYNIDAHITGPFDITSAAYTNSFGQTLNPANPVTMYTLDAANDMLFTQHPPSLGVQVNGVPITLNGAPLDFGLKAGFDIPAGVHVATNGEKASGRGYATLVTGGQSGFFSIDLSTGAATLLAMLAPDDSVNGVAVGDGPRLASSTNVSSPGPVTLGQPAELTATVTAPGATGTVSFSMNGGAIPGCTAFPINAAGVAECNVYFGSAQTFQITATYSGNAFYRASKSAPYAQVLTAIPTATAIAAAPNPAVRNQPIVYTATMTPAPVSGLVRFTSDGVIIPGCAGVPNVAGAATCTTSFTTTRPRVIVASFLGDGLYGPSTSAPLTHTLTRTPTTTMVMATPNPGEPERPVTFTATVSPADATGEVTFSLDGVDAGSAPLAGGQAVFVHPGFEPGTRQVTASYAGTVDTHIGSISAPAPFTTQRYQQSFAEGSTGFFRTQIGFFNTSAAEPADVRMTLYPETGSPVALELTLDPLARRSFDLHALIGSVSGVSTRIESSKPIAATRQLTWDTPVRGSTLESGIAKTSMQWYFAEGATNAFSLFYLIQNPGSTPAQVTFTHLLEGGAEPVTKTATVPAHARRTFAVNDLPGLASAALSTAISSDVPIVAERAMYLNLARPLDAGTVSRGATALATSWSLAEGATGFFHTYLLLGNPGADAAIATVHYLLSDSTVIEREYRIAPRSRLTVDVKQEAPALAAATFGVTLTSTLPIVAERAMWWGEPVWYEGSVSLGSIETGTVWGIGEGTEGGASNDATFVLVANTSATDGIVRFTVSYDDATTEQKEFAVAANTRLTVRMGEEFAKTAGQRFSVLVESLTMGVPIAVESASYQSPDGVFGTSGGSAPATRVR